MFEAPHRIRRTLTELCEADPDRRATLTREMTKRYEEAITGTLSELCERVTSAEPKGEYTLVLGPSSRRTPPLSLAEAVDSAQQLIEQGMRPATACRKAGRLSGVPSREIYQALLVPEEPTE